MTQKAAIDREDYAHPEKIYKDLISILDGKVSEEDKEKIKGLRFWASPPKKEELCWSCGWNVYHQ